MFVKDVPDDDLYFWGENELNALLQPGVNEAKPSGYIFPSISIVLNASLTSERVCFVFSGMGILVSAATWSALGLRPEEKVVKRVGRVSGVRDSWGRVRANILGGTRYGCV